MVFTNRDTVCRFRHQLAGWKSGYHWLACRILRLQKKYSLDNNCMIGFFKFIVQFNILPIRKWSSDGAGRSWVWFTSARLNVQCFHNQQNIPNAGRKKKDTHYVPVKEQALLIIYLCPVTQPKTDLTNALLVSSSKFSFCFLKMKFFLLNSVLMRSVMTDLWGWNQENWRESFGDFMYSPIHYRVLLKIKFTIN